MPHALSKIDADPDLTSHVERIRPFVGVDLVLERRTAIGLYAFGALTVTLVLFAIPREQAR